MNPIVRLEDVSKIYKSIKAVDHVSLTIERGTIVAILGPNGAGKTTTISMMLGLLECTAGKVQLFGRRPDDRSVRGKIGAMLQDVSVPDGLSVGELIDLFRSYYSAPFAKAELLKMSGLEQEARKKAEKLSGGQKRRLGFALALAGNPELLFLDEPTAGMDIASRRLFWETIQSLAGRGATILFTTHYLQEADDIANRIVLFSKGTIVADGSPEQVKAKLSHKTVSFRMPANCSEDLLRSLPTVSDLYSKGDRIYLAADDTDAVVASLYGHGLTIQGLQIDQGRLEEAFEQLTRGHEEAAAK